MALSIPARDVLIRAAKTFVQAFAPTATAAYTTFEAHSGAVTPILVSGGLAAGAAGVSVIWNGLGALVGTRRAAQLEALAKAIDDAVAKHDAAKVATITVTPVIPAPTVQVTPPVAP